MACEESYDAVVVGSGYGGSVAACRMSMAGINVCLLEKGRQWEAQDFPTDVFSLFSAVKFERRKWPGISFGSDKALFQIHEEGDSLAAVACGLGGGSLINAGVLLPTPLRTRRDPKWPKEWNTDWEKYELLASSMLGAQPSPVEFNNGRIIKQIVCEEIEDYKPDPIKLSINFDRKEEDDDDSLVGKKKLENCLACGNCLSGCPYNAKNSTDKNYLAVATKAGCVVKTERKVQYIVKNSCEVHELNGKNHQRRWRLYLDDLDYISADFVVLSAGVLGTTEILFKSQRRGMGLSERFGLGLSCNGNNVAYVARSRAPLHAHGLNKNQFSEVPFQIRPGPAISSSFTSSAGFTIQGGVIPTSYPNLIFKGITAYGWPPCYWFLHGLIDKIKCNIMRSKASQDMILNVIGHDSSDGIIAFDDEAEKIRITSPHDPLLPKKILALQNLTRKLGGILFMSKYRSTCVHLLGGCNAATNSSLGVCNPKGQVFNPINTNHLAVHEGLYVSDASLIPCSVGTNPCLTITALSERISQALVNDVIKFKSEVRVKENNQNMVSVPKINGEVQGNMWSDKVVVRETMRGFIGGMPCTAYLTMNMNYRGKGGFVNKNSFIGGSHSFLKGRAGGYVVFKSVSKEKLFILDGEVDLCEVDSRTPYTQYMHYGLTLASTSGSRYKL
ncbi:Long-chain-alcohol oxidase FAO1 [Platanthera guangdongensis]|uniref:Cholesterol oxidase n=1 Tax=Platanthera guangdongensis TaxID=2320717 RepID=A0ABR2N5Q3_9ASPA